MKVEGTIPVKMVEMEIPGDDVVAAIRTFKQTYPDARVETIDGDLIRGICACGMPVKQKDTGYGFDAVTKTYSCPACNAGKRKS